MGCGSSSSKFGGTQKVENLDESGETRTTWTHELHTENYLSDPILPDVDDVSDHVYLLQTLRNVVGQRHLGEFAKKLFQVESLMCFVDIEEYKAIPTSDYRRAKAKHIYSKYVKVGAVLELGLLNVTEREELEELIDDSQNDESLLSSNTFHLLQQRAFLSVYHNTFLRFKADDRSWSTYNDGKYLHLLIFILLVGQKSPKLTTSWTSTTLNSSRNWGKGHLGG